MPLLLTYGDIRDLLAKIIKLKEESKPKKGTRSNIICNQLYITNYYDLKRSKRNNL